ncbi:MAG: hypothetical protein CYG60_10960 [Actinobacteria bacterium]|nr:MAG: hypothetical protein CYG60_10960 [Actinomycetota bacterium]
MLEANRDKFVRLFREFAQTYPQTPDGQDHLVAYERDREQGRQNFEEIVAATTRGEDVADRVLLASIPKAVALVRKIREIRRQEGYRLRPRPPRRGLPT